LTNPATSPLDGGEPATNGAAARHRRRSLDRGQVIAAAIGYIDRHGLEHLTMRRLGGVLDVEAMALYRYITSRDDLLDGVADTLLDHLADDPVIGPDWPGYLRRLAQAARTSARDHPAAFGLACTRPVPAAGIRPPLRSPRVIESFFTTLSGYGVDDTAAVSAYQAFSTFLFGHLQPIRVSRSGTGPLTLSDYPHVRWLTAAPDPRPAGDEPLETVITQIASVIDR
jgi:AcrR family transcriptional regulator